MNLLQILLINLFFLLKLVSNFIHILSQRMFDSLSYFCSLFDLSFY